MWLDVARPAAGAMRWIFYGAEMARWIEVRQAIAREPVAATMMGSPYQGIQADLVPDHVALLPERGGACSVADGCSRPAQC